MKILALSLLRIGDILMHRELARGIQSQFPGAEIHFLINEQFSSVKDLVPEVSAWKTLPRKQIQDILVFKTKNAQGAARLLQAVVSELSAEKYDLVLNLTNNFLSVRLMDLIQAGEKRGSALENGRKVRDANRWQSYLNDHFSVQGGSRFHYVEVLARALEISVPRKTGLRKSRSSAIYFQLFTSDTKKNWGLQRFQKLIHELREIFPQYLFLGLCSPAERDMALNYFSEKEIVSPSLAEAKDLLSQAQLLVTGDTSLQHLAAQVGCETVSLFLGSADATKTPAWQEGTWVVSSQVPCAPCAHSSPCSQREHLCADQLSVSRVLQLVKGILSQTAQRIPVRPDMEKATWTAYLENELQSRIPRFATLAREHHPVSMSIWQQECVRQAAMNSFLVEIKFCVDEISRSLLVYQKSGNYRGLKALIQEFIQKFTAQKDFVQQFLWAFESTNEFEMIKGFRKAWLELSELVEIRGKLLQEARGLYVREPSAPQEHSSPT